VLSLLQELAGQVQPIGLERLKFPVGLSKSIQNLVFRLLVLKLETLRLFSSLFTLSS
jgi:hypothetical protein